MSIKSFGARVRNKLAKIVAARRPSQPEEADHTGNVPSCDVLFVNGCDLPALHRYRVLHQREQLEILGISTDEVHYTQTCAQDAQRAEVFVVYRCPITPGVEACIAAAHQLGKRVYFDVDDLVTSTSYTDALPVVQAMSEQDKAVFDDGVNRNGQTLALCDGAIVTTERLAQELGKVVPTVLVNRNVASLQMAELSQAARLAAQREERSDTDRVTIGYFSGSMTHNADFQEVLPALVEAMAQRSELYLKVVGDLELPPELEPYQERVVHAQRVDWTELPQLIASVDINLAPLEPTLFNEAKSENKWTEAALVGVPTIASDFGAFKRMMSHGETGLLCAGTQAWKEAILALVDDAQMRVTIGERARLWVLAHGTTRSTGGALANLLMPEKNGIDTLTPAGEEDRTALVSALLTARGLTPQAASYDDKPWLGASLEQRRFAAQAGLTAGRQLAIFVYERACGDDATFRYYGYNAVQRLGSSQRWAGIWLFVDELDEERELLAQASAVILIRCRIRPELIRLAQHCADHDVPLSYLLDDHALGAQTASRIIQAMATNPADPFERAFWTGTTERFRLASELCSSLITPVGFYSELLRASSGKPVFTLHASLNDEQVSVANHILETRGGSLADRRFLVAYLSGTASHNADFALVESSLVAFLSQHPQACLLLGGHLRLSEALLPFLQTGQLVLVPRVDYVTLQYLQAAADLILAPLVIDDFTNCKSGLKVFEAGVVGTPACASPSSAYCEAIVDGTTGFVCRDAKDWLAALEWLAASEDVRASMGTAARAKALARYYGSTILAEIEDACDGVAALSPVPTFADVAAAVADKDIADWDNPFTTNPAFAEPAPTTEP